MTLVGLTGNAQPARGIGAIPCGRRTDPVRHPGRHEKKGARGLAVKLFAPGATGSAVTDARGRGVAGRERLNGALASCGDRDAENFGVLRVAQEGLHGRPPSLAPTFSPLVTLFPTPE